MTTSSYLCAAALYGLCGLIAATVALGGGPSFSGGTGEADNPFQISTAQEFLSIGSNPDLLDKHFVLSADLDLGPSQTDVKVFSTAPIASAKQFTGVFDGKCHSVRHLVIRADNSDCVGLFGYVGEEGRIKDLAVEDCNVVGRDCVGALIGSNFGTVSKCHSSGIVVGNRDVGGLLGLNEGVAEACQSVATVQGKYATGGLAGINLDRIESSQGDGQADGIDYVAGLVGMNFGSIRRSVSTGSICGEQSVGGLVGYVEGTIMSSYSTGRVNGIDSVGGLLGNHWSGLASYCYAAGPVSGRTKVGGLVGESYEGSVYLSYWNRAASGQAASAGGRGKTPDEMKTLSTYKGWGSTGDWVIDDGNDYPHTAWEGTEGQLIRESSSHYGGGNGEPNDPYRISTVEDLINIGYYPQDWDKHFILMQDLDTRALGSNALVPIGRADLPFTGVFDGNDHHISGFDFTGLTQPWVGLFGVIGVADIDSNQHNGLVQDLHVHDVTVVGRDGVAGLAGLNRGEIRSCTVESANIMGQDEIGGLIGRNEGIIVCSGAQGAVEGSGVCAGGLTGSNQGCVLQSWADCQVNSEQDYTGDLIGCDWSSDSDLDCEDAIAEDIMSDGKADFKNLTLMAVNWLRSP